MEFSAIIAAAATISGIALGWLGAGKSFKKDVAQEASTDAVQRTDVEYIKRGVDDIRVDLRLHGQRVDGLAERVTRVEESSKQAHKRLDRIEEKGVC